MLLFLMDAYIESKVIERLTKSLEEKTGKKCVIIPDWCSQIVAVDEDVEIVAMRPGSLEQLEGILQKLSECRPKNKKYHIKPTLALLFGFFLGALLQVILIF